MSNFHTPVLLNEVISYLEIQNDSWYIDCNLGGGGHTEKILKNGGKVLGIDLDEEAIKFVAGKHDLEVKEVEDERFARSESLILHQSNFSLIKYVVAVQKVTLIRGVLFDLGLSSYQLEKGERGFSFNSDAPLDMRMDQNANLATAADLVNGMYERELADLFFIYGEERNSRKIAKRIVEERKDQPIRTTKHLADIVRSASFSHESKIHPATKVFQALRIAVNDELNNLAIALPGALDVLEVGGRIVVISFHSLEDRIVKNYFKQEEEKGKLKIITDTPIEPSEEEVESNPRSRSAKMRVAQKV